MAEVGIPTPPTVDGAPWWPSLATPAWLGQAEIRGIAATDCTTEMIDHLRDRDRDYAGSVRVGGVVLDLLVDPTGCVRVAPEHHYFL